MEQESAEIESCSRCEKPLTLCFCKDIVPVENERFVVILQHPQEPDKLLGSARIANLSLKNSALVVGLSWPSLPKMLARTGYKGTVAPSEWAVLYLGANKKGEQKPRGRLRAFAKYKNEIDIDDESSMNELCESIKGIIVIDGTWSQAKALWWRNAWLSKLKRLALYPRGYSLYGNLRREPRRECLSSIESIAEVLEALGEPAENSAKLRSHFSTLIEKCKPLLLNKPRR